MFFGTAAILPRRRKFSSYRKTHYLYRAICATAPTEQYVDWITDQIAIGNYLDAKTLPANVNAVLCLKSQCCDEGRTDVATLCTPLVDGPGNRRDLVLEAIDYISNTVIAGERILVHCHAGRSRSVCIVAAYLMKSQGLSKSQALALIQAKREVWLSDGVDEIFAFLR